MIVGGGLGEPGNEVLNLRRFGAEQGPRSGIRSGVHAAIQQDRYGEARSPFSESPVW